MGNFRLQNFEFVILEYECFLIPVGDPKFYDDDVLLTCYASDDGTMKRIMYLRPPYIYNNIQNPAVGMVLVVYEREPTMQRIGTPMPFVGKNFLCF